MLSESRKGREEEEKEEKRREEKGREGLSVSRRLFTELFLKGERAVSQSSEVSSLCPTAVKRREEKRRDGDENLLSNVLLLGRLFQAQDIIELPSFV
jgi:hypothetical protein